MNKFLSSIFIPMLLATSVCQAITTIKIRGDQWCPYNCDPASGAEGYQVDILRAIFEPEYKIDYKMMSWSRAIIEAKQGKIDGLVGATDYDGAELLYPKESLGLSVSYFFSIKEKNLPSISKIADVDNKKIGIISDYRYGPLVDRLVAQKHPAFVKFFGDSAQQKILRTMLGGRLDYILEDPQVISAVLASMKLKADTLKANGALDQAPLRSYVVFSKAKPSSKDLVKKFEEGVKQIRKSGKLLQILKKYNLEDWEK